MEPKFVSRPAFTVAGLVHRGTVDGQKISALWGQFFERASELQNMIGPQVAYGLMANYDEGSGEFDYVAGMEVSGPDGLPPGFVAYPIPASEWAVFTTTMAGMPQAYPYIYHTWLPQSGCQHLPIPEFELYGETFDPTNPDSTMEIYIPVARA